MNTYYKRTKSLFKKIFCIIFSFITIISAGQSAFAYAAINSSNKLDSSDVLSDLRSDENFNINAYPFNENGELQLISFNEYCYSFYSNLQSNYGLYVYIYNPQSLKIVQNSTLNKIEMAVKYDESGNPKDYEKFQLKFCSVSTESNYYRLFYKFKVVDPQNKIYATLNSNERRYDVSGIELYTEGQTNAVDHEISRTFYYTGYAAGYGPNNEAESTLACRTETLETITLDVHHTYWRSLTSSKGAGYQNQLDTVYFTVPNRFFEEYGKLQRIKAEWYEYKTKDIVVTSNREFYNKAQNYIGVKTTDDYMWGMPVYNSDIGISLGQNAGDWGGGLQGAIWGWNLGTGYLQGQICNPLYYLFPTPNWTSINNYDPYATVNESGGVSYNDLYDYILNYNKTYENGTVKDGMISADLFESDIDDDRKTDTEYGKIQYGYSYYDFDADMDLFDLLAYDPYEHDFWSNAFIYNWWNALLRNYGDTGTSFTEQSPILVLDKDEYFAGNNTAVSERLFVNYNDVNTLKSVYNTAQENDEKLVLFRFAVSDYYCADIDIIKLGGGVLGTDSHTSGQAYRAQESVFLDFDIIQLTFNKDGIYTVIPVVASPIDIVDDITPPYNPVKNGMPWWWYLVIAVAVIIAVILLINFLPYILKGLFYVIKYLAIGVYYVVASPAYLIWWLVNRKK